MNLLVTLDQNYLPPLKVLLQSAFLNNPGETFHIYMIHDSIPESEIRRLDGYCKAHGANLTPICAEDSMFEGAPVFSYFTRAMYYRLLAFHLLPDTMNRVLYLDPDMLVINPLRGLYDTEFGGRLFAACMLTGYTGYVKIPINRIRLGNKADAYFNSGMLLMNLALLRQECEPAHLYDYIRQHRRDLILPDQDVLNGLYAERILQLDDALYNFDVSRHGAYRMRVGHKMDMEWMMTNTVILHFCGKTKPWMKNYTGRFGVLFRHYASLTDRAAQSAHLREACERAPEEVRSAL